MIYNSSVNSIDSSAIAAVSLKFHYKITNSSCHAKEGGGESYQYFINTLRKKLFFKGYRNLPDFSSEGGGYFGDFDPNVLTLWKPAVDGVDDPLGHMFQNVRFNLHFVADGFVYGEVVDRVVHVIAGSRKREVGFDRNVHQETISYDSFERIAAVKGPELHLF